MVALVDSGAMPVLVAPADTPLGVPLVRALRNEGAEVRAYATGDGDVGALRASGAFVATGELEDEGRLDAAMTDAHTVVGLHADPLVGDASRLDTDLRVFLTAAEKAGVARVVVRSVPRPSPHADALRRVCAGIEAALHAMAVPTMAVRTSLVDTPALRDALVSVAGATGDPDLEVAPLHVEDLVAALVALDAARATATTGHILFRLQGRRRRLGDYLDHLGRGDLVGRVYLPSDRVPLLRPSLDTPWVETEAGATADLLAFAERTPRPLAP